MIRILISIGVLQAVAIAMNVVRSKVISVALGPAGLGMVGTIDQLLNTLVQVCTFSLPAVALKMMSRVSLGQSEAFRRSYTSFLNTVLLLSLAGAALVGAGLHFDHGVLGAELGRYSVEVTIALATVPVLALGLLLPNVLAARQQPVGAAALNFGSAAAAAAAAWIGLRLGGMRDLYVLQLVAGTALMGGMLLYFQRRLRLPIYDRHATLTAHLRDSPEVVRSAVAVYISVSGYSLSLLALRYATLRSMGPEPVGFLQAVLSIVLAVGTVLGAMNGHYLGPTLNQPSNVLQKIQTATLFRKRQLILLALGAAPLVTFPEPILSILFSPRFVPAAAWLPPLLVWQLLVLQGNVQQQLLFSLDDLSAMAVTNIAGAVTSSALSFVLVPRFGLNGAAAAMLIGALLTNALGAERIRRTHGYPLQATSILLGAYVTVALLGVPYVLQIVGVSHPLVSRAAACAALMAGLWFFLDGTEKAALTAFARPVPRAGY